VEKRSHSAKRKNYALRRKKKVVNKTSEEKIGKEAPQGNEVGEKNSFGEDTRGKAHCRALEKAEHLYKKTSSGGKTARREGEKIQGDISENLPAALGTEIARGGGDRKGAPQRGGQRKSTNLERGRRWGLPKKKGWWGYLAGS